MFVARLILKSVFYETVNFLLSATLVFYITGFYSQETYTVGNTE